ncbi:MAG: MFS transporter, partial [Caldisericaceae bacterium]
MEKKSNLIFYSFALITAMIGFDWFMWGPIIHSVVEPRYNAPVFLLTIFISAIPLMLVIFSYFSGNLADRDPKRTTIIAALLLGITSLAKPFVLFNFDALLIVHLIFALSAVYCFTSWSPLTYRLFEKDFAAQRIALFTAALTTGEFLGYLLTFITVQKIGLFSTLLFYGIVSAIVSAFYIYVISKNSFAYSVQPRPRPSIVKGFKLILKEKAMAYLFVIAFLDIGVFAWIATWYPKLFTSFKGIGPEQASLVTSMKLIGCLIGALTVPVLSHKLKQVKIFFIILPIISALMFFLVPFVNNYYVLLLDSLVLGLTLFPVYPIGVHLPSAYTKIGIEYAGIGSGIILIFANLGGFLLPQLGVLTHSLWSSLVVFGIVPMLLISVTAIFFT